MADVTLRVDRDSRWLYEAALASDPALAEKFGIEVRPDESASLRDGERTLSRVRTYLRTGNLPDDRGATR